MKSDALLQLARQTTDQIHDEVLFVRALLELAELEEACEADSDATLASAERLVWEFSDPAAQAVFACDLAQSVTRLGRDPYRLLDLARSTSVRASICGEIYVALVEAKLGDHPDRKLRWAEDCARIQRPSAWLVKTQAAIVRIQSDVGDWSAARSTIRRMDDPLQQVLSCCELAISAHKQGNDWALDAAPPINAIPFLCDRVHAQCALAMTAHSIGIDASAFLQQSVDLAAQLGDAENRQVAAVLLARVLAHRQELGVALHIVEALPEPAQQEALLAMCEQTALAGNVEATRMLTEELLVPGYRDRALLQIVRSAARAVGPVSREPSAPCPQFQI